MARDNNDKDNAGNSGNKWNGPKIKDYKFDMENNTLKLPFDQEIERACLACLIKFPDSLIEFIGLVKENDFAVPANQNIFTILQEKLEKQEKINPILLKAHLNLIGPSPFQGISTDDYIDSLVNLQSVSEQSCADYFARLTSMGFSRKVIIDARDLAVETRKNAPTATPEEIIETTEKYLADILTIDVKSLDKPVDVYKGIRERVVNQNIENNKVLSPFPIFNNLYGHFRKGSLSVICAGFGQGKSTMLTNIAMGCLDNTKNNACVLQIDTEMSSKINENRILSNLSGVSEYYISTGEWKLHTSMREKIFAAIEFIEKQKDLGFYHHIYVGDKPMSKILHIIKRFNYLDVDKGKNLIAVYDYIKIANGEIKGNAQEWQALGEKTNSLQKIMGELDIIGLAGVQGTDAGTVAGSRRIADFADNVYLLLEKPAEEVADHGEDRGTHRLNPIKTRFQGPNAQGFKKHVMVELKGKKTAVPNFINYDFTNFCVEERGTMEDILREGTQTHVEKTSQNDGDYEDTL